MPLCKIPPEPYVKGTWRHLSQADPRLVTTEGRKLNNDPLRGKSFRDVTPPPPSRTGPRGGSGTHLRKCCANEYHSHMCPGSQSGEGARPRLAAPPLAPASPMPLRCPLGPGRSNAAMGVPLRNADGPLSRAICAYLPLLGLAQATLTQRPASPSTAHRRRVAVHAPLPAARPLHADSAPKCWRLHLRAPRAVSTCDSYRARTSDQADPGD